MVKFGKHQQVFLDNLGLPDLYTVPYDEFKHKYIPPKVGDDEDNGRRDLDLNLPEPLILVPLLHACSTFTEAARSPSSKCTGPGKVGRHRIDSSCKLQDLDCCLLLMA